MITLFLLQGNPGLLNEFYVSMNDDGQTSFESVVYSGIFLGCDENGQIAIASDTVENKWFNLKTKVMVFLVSRSLIGKQKGCYSLSGFTRCSIIFEEIKALSHHTISEKLALKMIDLLQCTQYLPVAKLT